MARRVVVVAIATLLAVPAMADPSDDPVVVDLTSRVPSRWLSDMTDDWPLTPERWRRRMPAECRTRGGYRRLCQGERLIPHPVGPEAELARRMGLGQRATVLHLMHNHPFEEWMALVAHMDTDEALTFPVTEGRLGRGFGRTRGGALSQRRHWGVDIGADEGAPILAAREGIVVYSDNGLTGFGNAVMLLHGEGHSTFYAHCRRVLVFAGQRVERAEQIAEVGQTGFAPAPHLHFEWRQRGWARDPVRQFRPRER